MVKLGSRAAMVFDFVYVCADAASLDYSFQGQPLHACLLSFAAVVTVFTALLAFTLLFKLPTACKSQLLLLMPYILLQVIFAFRPAVFFLRFSWHSGAKALPLRQNLAQSVAVILGRWKPGTVPCSPGWDGASP